MKRNASKNSGSRISFVLHSHIRQAPKLRGVRYDVRGPILQEAERLERDGRDVLRLNIGNPAPFGFEAPDTVRDAVARALSISDGYSDSRGILSAREAVAAFMVAEGIVSTTVDDVFIGNGVSELISLVLQAMLGPGDEVLIPAPDYPLWTAQVTLSGGTAVHYLCDETDGWQPNLGEIESLITPRTRALVLINPNNPSGSVYSAALVRGFAEIAERHGLVLLADEIYEKILYDDAEHVRAASFVHETLCITFSGLSKAYLVAGYRSGWLVLSGNKARAAELIEGITLLANMRMCANVPAQHAIAPALADDSQIRALTAEGGRLYEQSRLAHALLTDIPGVSCVKPAGALYLFPKLDPLTYPIENDQQFVIDLLRATGVLITNGRGFNFPTHDHVRFVTLPDADVLTDAIGRIAGYLEMVRKDPRRLTATIGP